MDFVSAFGQLKKGNFIKETGFENSEYYFMINNSMFSTDKLNDKPKFILNFYDIDADSLFQLQQLLNPKRDYTLVVPKKILLIPPLNVLKNLDNSKVSEFYYYYENKILNSGCEFDYINRQNDNLETLKYTLDKLKTCDAVYFTKDWNKSTNTVLINLITENYNIKKVFEEREERGECILEQLTTY